MAGEPITTIVGNLTGDPELRYTSSGAAVANFTIANTPRTFNRETGEWAEGTTMFTRCSIWREAAENVAESLGKGMRVIAIGSLVQRDFEKDGEKRHAIELQVDSIGPDLRYATAQVAKATKGGGGNQQGQRPAQAENKTRVNRGQQSAPASDYDDDAGF